ncbi:MAG: hypothetical protein MJ252_07145 [archaeon]|nr:hypothetical protein [archaeon]
MLWTYELANQNEPNSILYTSQSSTNRTGSNTKTKSNYYRKRRELSCDIGSCITSPGDRSMKMMNSPGSNYGNGSRLIYNKNNSLRMGKKMTYNGIVSSPNDGNKNPIKINISDINDFSPSQKNNQNDGNLSQISRNSNNTPNQATYVIDQGRNQILNSGPNVNENYKAEIENLINEIKSRDDIIEDLKKSLADANTTISSLRNENEQIKKEMGDIAEADDNIKRENEELKKENDLLHQKISENIDSPSYKDTKGSLNKSKNRSFNKKENIPERDDREEGEDQEEGEDENEYINPKIKKGKKVILKEKSKERYNENDSESEEQHVYRASKKPTLSNKNDSPKRQDLESEIEKLKRRIDQLMNELREKEEIIDKLKEQRDGTERDNNEEIDNLKRELELFKLNNDDLKGQIKSLQDKIKNLEQALRDEIGKNINLQREMEKKARLKAETIAILKDLFRFYINVRGIFFTKEKPDELQDLIDNYKSDELRSKIGQLEEVIRSLHEAFHEKFGRCFACDIACCCSSRIRMKFFQRKRSSGSLATKDSNK